ARPARPARRLGPPAQAGLQGVQARAGPPPLQAVVHPVVAPAGEPARDATDRQELPAEGVVVGVGGVAVPAEADRATLLVNVPADPLEVLAQLRAVAGP